MRRFVKDCGDGAKAKPRLTLHVVRNDAVPTNSNLAGTEHHARPGLDFDPMRVICEGRVDRVRVQSAHLANASITVSREVLCDAAASLTMAPKLQESILAAREGSEQ